MADLLVLSSVSFTQSAAENSPATPPAKRFAPSATSISTNTSPSRSHSASRRETERKDADSSCLFSGERFRRYDLALQVYDAAVRNGRLAQGANFSDSTCRQNVYQLVFDVLYRKTDN
jgi:hypothetical protein